jgi:hypothetical protein
MHVTLQTEATRRINPAAWLRRGAGLVLLCTTGCVTTLGPHLPWSWGDRPPRGEVAQVVALWADGIDVQPDPMCGGRPTPGLAGRVFLFDAQMSGVEADGMVSVYLYDDAQPPTDQPLPREVWNIDPMSLQRVLKKDGLGWGYSLWLPWSNYRPEIRNVTLVVRYQSSQGKELWSGAMTAAMRDAAGIKTPSQLQAQTRVVEDQRVRPPAVDSGAATPSGQQGLLPMESFQPRQRASASLPRGNENGQRQPAGALDHAADAGRSRGADSSPVR